MKKLLFALSLFTTFVYSQTRDEITEGVKSVLTNKEKGLTDEELKEFIKRYNKANKDLKDLKDYSVETNEVAKSEFDSVTALKQSGIHQLKVGTEGNYYVVKYIDLDLPYDTFKNLQKAYKDLKIGAQESKETFVKRKEAALKAKNDANPFKICYLPLTGPAVTTLKGELISFNIVTVPFKIYPKTSSNRSQVNGDIDNVGLFTAFRAWNFSKFKRDGTETKRSIGFGLYLAPSVVKLNEENTGIAGYKEINKAYLTTALAASFKYGNFTVMLIPAGVDTALSSSGKDWKYDGHYWWGFGLGIDTSLFNF